MKKLFRIKYEPCNGTCYAPGDVFFTEMRKLGKDKAKVLAGNIQEAHDFICDNPDYSFGVDLCEDTGIFISHFRQPERTDVFTGRTLPEALNKMVDAVCDAGDNALRGGCNFGLDGEENLAIKIMESVG